MPRQTTNNANSAQAVQFHDPQLLKEQTIESQLKAVGPDGHYLGGVVWEELKGRNGESLGAVVHIGNPFLEQPDIKTLPTRCTKDQIDQIRSSVIWTKEACELMTLMATAYELRMPLIIEGESAIGKTFIANKFTESLFGAGVKPQDFYCSGQTDVSGLMAKWVPNPNGMSDDDKAKWTTFVQSEFGQKQIDHITKEIESAEGLSDDFRAAMLRTKLTDLSKSVGLSGNTQWKLELGALPKAMLAKLDANGNYSYPEQGGHGTILHIQEVGIAKPAVVNALLSIRGKNRKVAESIQLWEDGGRLVRSGPEFWVVFSTNPPEGDFLERNPIDPALARGTIFVRMGDLSPESYGIAAQAYCSYKIGNRPKTKPPGCHLEIYNHPEIAKEIASILATFHLEYKQALKKGEKNREQKIPATLDDMAGVAGFVLTTQVRDRSTGNINLTETLRRGITMMYISRLGDEMAKDMTKLLESILTSKETGAKNFRGKVQTRQAILETLVSEVSMEPDKREALLDKRHLQAVEAAKKNDAIPDHIKRMLGGNKN
jgi:hypothetical protein